MAVPSHDAGTRSTARFPQLLISNGWKTIGDSGVMSAVDAGAVSFGDWSWEIFHGGEQGVKPWKIE